MYFTITPLQVYISNHRTKLLHELRKECNNFEHNINIMKHLYSTNKCTTMLDRFRMLRFEDIARQPQGIAREVYKFLGIKPDPKIFKWLRTIQSKKGSSEANKTDGDVTDVELFSTRKKSIEVVDSWRKHLPYDFVKDADSECSSIPKEFGYKAIADRNSYDDFNHSLVLRFPLPRQIYLDV